MQTALFHTTFQWENRWICPLIQFISMTLCMMERSSTGVWLFNVLLLFFLSFSSITHHPLTLHPPSYNPPLCHVVVQFLWWQQRQTVVSGPWWFTVRQYLMGIIESSPLTQLQNQIEPIRVFCWHSCLGYGRVNNLLHDTKLIFSVKEKGRGKRKWTILQYQSQKPKIENDLCNAAT